MVLLFALLVCFIVACTLAIIGKPLLLWGAYGLTAVAVGIVMFYDFEFVATQRTKYLVYSPLLIEAVIVGVAVVLYSFRLPELCFHRMKPIHLYINSYIVLVFCVFSLMVEVLQILTYLVRLKEGNLSKEEQAQFLD